MNLYSYKGPVMQFDKCIADHWEGETIAPSEKRARVNLLYQFKMQCGKTPGSNIWFPGKLVIKG